MKKRIALIILIVAVLLSTVCFTQSFATIFEHNNIMKIASISKTRVIDDGTYTIRIVANPNLVLDIGGASRENGGNLQLWDDAHVPQQEYRVKYIGNGYYNIISVNSEKYIDVLGGSTQPGANVQQWESNSTDAQKWIIEKNDDGYYSIISKASELYLETPDSNVTNGSNLQINTKNNSNNQKFIFDRISVPEGKQSVANGIYTIKCALNENYVIDVGGASKENGGNLQIWYDAGVPQQRFNLTYIGSGYYSITAMHSEKVIDVSGGSTSAGANVQQWESNSTDAQKWIILKNEDDSYSIIAKASGLYLTAKDGATNGSNIEIEYKNYNETQKFKLVDTNNNTTNPDSQEPEPIETVSEGTYIIRTALNENFAFDVDGISQSNGANIQLWQDSNVPQQKFVFKYIGKGYYNIIAVHSGKLLDVSGGSTQPRANVQQWESNSTDAQKWIVKQSSNGYYNILSKSSKLGLTVEDGANNSSNIDINTFTDSDAQKFELLRFDTVVGNNDVQNGSYKIRSAENEQFVLDVGGALKTNGANIQLWKDSDVSQQRYIINNVGNGDYTLIAAHSNKAIDVCGGSTVPGTNVQQWNSNSTESQKWILKKNNDGYYNIICQSNQLYLTYADGAQNGSNVQVNYNNNSINQKFILEEVRSINISESKYPGYKEKIESLMEKHPTWNFELLYTTLNFNDAVYGEYSNHKANLVPSTYKGEWVCPVCGTTLYDSGWYGASEKAIAYYMDPRNFLDDINAFQFLDVNSYLDGTCTIEGIQNQVNNSFLQNYANDINTACKNKNVNPYYIISRLFQEQGKNGTTIGKGMDGGDGKTYYNPFNIGAHGDGYTEIYNNALAYAKNAGWDTMEKAIEGGIYFCKDNWLDNYQNTLYQNRFDIDKTNGSALYAHQYMQNLLGAYSEARLLRGMYANTNKLDSNFTFIIPVYENMSKTVSPIPSSDTETPQGQTSETYPMNVETTGTYVRIRSAATTDGSTILRTIADKGTKLLSVQRGVNTNWQKVVTNDGLIGYISGDYVKQIDDIKTCNYSAVVKTNDGNGCNIRIGPSTELDKLGALPDYTNVTVIDNSTYNNVNGYNWYRIVLQDGRQAFIPSVFLK